MKFIKLFLLLSNVLSICAAQNEQFLKIIKEEYPKIYKVKSTHDKKQMTVHFKPYHGIISYVYLKDYDSNKTYIDLVIEIINEQNRYKLIYGFDLISNDKTSIYNNYKIFFNGKKISRSCYTQEIPYDKNGCVISIEPR